ncbi:hypothetical protein COV20_05690 [Candidatus Woesearchaeota archaeon CG10_big_fil_rev_8_21_14_0_10_45_16]|nr:MAG: hypothetical protein COV20_05690 [Candidatus Woesearchaeota archaeon CG10_big_fil_rev_8_21_14_0_10_45_16]
MAAKKIRSLSLSKVLFFPLSLLLSLPVVKAHCPLCTAGAAVAAGGAVYLGVNPVVVSLFVGAFAVSTGWWASTWIKKRYVPFQKTIIVVLSFLLTVLPILPVISGQPYPLYLSLVGEYGSWLHRIYLINTSLLGSIFGGLIVSSTPWLSRKISSLRAGGKVFPFQGVILTLFLLIVAGTLMQVIL